MLKAAEVPAALMECAITWKDIGNAERHAEVKAVLI